MKLTGSDVLRLYGKKLFILEGDTSDDEKGAEATNQPSIQEKLVQETPPTQEKVILEEPTSQPESIAPDLSIFSSGAPIVWKMKPSAKLALILRKSEFTNRDLTGLLKQHILSAGIDPALVGFGVLEDDSQTVNIKDMTVSLALACVGLAQDFPVPVELGNKQLWCTSSLAEVSQAVDKQKELSQAMQALAQHLSTSAP